MVRQFRFEKLDDEHLHHIFSILSAKTFFFKLCLVLKIGIVLDKENHMIFILFFQVWMMIFSGQNFSCRGLSSSFSHPNCLEN
jgi:hypothetical protein